MLLGVSAHNVTMGEQELTTTLCCCTATCDVVGLLLHAVWWQQCWGKWCGGGRLCEDVGGSLFEHAHAEEVGVVVAWFRGLESGAVVLKMLYNWTSWQPDCAHLKQVVHHHQVSTACLYKSVVACSACAMCTQSWCCDCIAAVVWEFASGCCAWYFGRVPCVVMCAVCYMPCHHRVLHGVLLVLYVQKRCSDRSM